MASLLSLCHLNSAEPVVVAEESDSSGSTGHHPCHRYISRTASTRNNAGCDDVYSCDCLNGYGETSSPLVESRISLATNGPSVLVKWNNLTRLSHLCSAVGKQSRRKIWSYLPDIKCMTKRKCKLYCELDKCAIRSIQLALHQNHCRSFSCDVIKLHIYIIWNPVIRIAIYFVVRKCYLRGLFGCQR